jgi:hypothetical protein
MVQLSPNDPKTPKWSEVFAKKPSSILKAQFHSRRKGFKLYCTSQSSHNWLNGMLLGNINWNDYISLASGLDSAILPVMNELNSN